ncbi:MAG: ABC transporter permease [Deltaproteobacteria bacterium]|nr:ABC transporter permease [Deltaproteobacteria bacterium]
MKFFRFRTLWLRNSRVWRKHFMATLIGSLGQPLLFLLAMGYGLGREMGEIEGLTYLQFLAPGLTASAVMYSAAFETTYGSYTRLSLQKTYEAILMTPLNVTDIVLGEIVWGASKGLFAGIIMLAALPLFGVWPSAWTLTLLPVLFVSGMFFAAFGLIMTALATSYEFFNYFISLILTPLFLFSGIFFPLQSIAPTARIFFELLPLTPTVTLSRMLCYGQFSEPWLLKIVGSLLLTLLTCWLSIVLIRKRLIQ